MVGVWIETVGPKGKPVRTRVYRCYWDDEHYLELTAEDIQFLAAVKILAEAPE